MDKTNQIELENKPDIGFHQMELDDRILKAIAKQGWLNPTLIQEKAIPLLLEGKDVLIRARTGSGKTAAFAIPMIQKVLNSKMNATEQFISTLVIAPSKELCQQIKSVLDELTSKCQRIIRIVDITALQKHTVYDRPDIIVSTPSKILAQLKAENLNLRDGLETLIIDEADLIFSFGFENDLKEILDYLPPIYQATLASATLSQDVAELKKIILHNPVILKLEEPEISPTSQLTHYQISAEENDKAAILCTLFKLRLIRGKSIIFVNTIDRCYKLKLFLEQFNIKSCVLNSELPTKIRCHAVHQYNQGMYDIIIASDDQSLDKPGSKAGGGKKRGTEKESSIARGIDFQCVSNVLNFDFPLDVNAYIHRAGRTARGNNTGSILSLVDLKERDLIAAVEQHLKESYASEASIIKKYQFKMEEVESFRYRAQDAWRAITKAAVREARIKEIKLQMFNSEKLKSFFDNHPRDLQVLRHDKQLGTVKKQQHLADVPEYIVPETLKRVAGIATRKKRKHSSMADNNKSKRIFESKKSNPLLCAELDFGKKRKK